MEDVEDVFWVVEKLAEEFVFSYVACTDCGEVVFSVIN